MQEKETNIERFAPHSDKVENSFIPSNRVWVFRRGLGMDKTEDYFMFEKIDHLLIIYFTWLADRFPSLLRLFPFLGKVRQMTELQSERAISDSLPSWARAGQVRPGDGGEAAVQGAQEENQRRPQRGIGGPPHAGQGH
jgi:hypothetical protein